MGKQGVTTYDPEVHPRQAMLLCENGAVDREIAEFFDIAPGTFYRWRNQYPEFALALVAGKEVADERVVRSLYNRAVGYSYDSEKLVTVSLGDGNGSQVERHAIVEHVPPDVKAATRWLESRRPKEWGRKLSVGVSSEAEEPDFSGLDDDERGQLRDLLAKAAAGAKP